MYKNLTELKNDIFQDVKIDTRLYRKVEAFITTWRFKKCGEKDHSAFLGSNLIGVDTIVFSDGDCEKFYKEVLYISGEKIAAAFKNVDGINTDFNVASNPFFLTLICLLKMTYDSKLSKSEKKKLEIDLGVLMGYKMFSSMYNHFFRYKASDAVARATYERLSNRYLLKKYGNWQSVFEHRADDTTREGFFGDKINEFDTEEMGMIVAAVHTRYKDMLKNIYREYLDAIEKNEKIANSSKLSEGGEDGEVSVYGETISTHSSSIAYVKSIMGSERDLVNTSYIYLVSRLVSRCDQRQLEKVLMGISAHEYSSNPEDDYVERVLVASYAYLNTKGISANYSKNIQKCLLYLTNYWRAGKIKDPIAVEARKMCNVVSEHFMESNNKTLVPSIAIGLMLYIFCIAVANRNN